ncbi:hypothetical protein BSKO_09860 [Bryopsis sp. KO-2023]|nr:hypothetical protein BSKO_09860 [Bryopsis sp. KO-2023]
MLRRNFVGVFRREVSVLGAGLRDVSTQAEGETVGELFERIRGQAKAPPIFDRDLKTKHRDRSAFGLSPDDSLLSAVSSSLVDRLLDAKRKFPHAVVLGGQGRYVAQEILKIDAGIEEVTFIDGSQRMLDSIKRLEEEYLKEGKYFPKADYILGDEETIPLRKQTANLIVSCLGMHWVNDLPAALVQCLLALKPDGLFLANMFGGNTLQELRIAFNLAEQEREGGVSPRISPLVQMNDTGSLLSGAGFNLIGVDVDDITIKYKNAWELIQHLRMLGESGASLQRRKTLSRDVAIAVGAAYQGLFGEEDGYVPATFQVMNMTGWAPDSSQQKPSRRGSASASLEDIDKVMEEMEIKHIEEDKS